MKSVKKILAITLCIVMICVCFVGCSSNTEEKYTEKTLIIGYTEAAAPFLEIDKDGKATGFEPELWGLIFESIKGDLTDYVFEQVDEGYMLEESGGFTDSNGKVYSAGLLFGMVNKNTGTVNENYSFTEPLITDRVIAITTKDSKIKSFNDFKGANAVIVGAKYVEEAFNENTAISSACKSVKTVDTIDDALAIIDSNKADVIITNELTFIPTGKADDYSRLENELDTIEFCIATAKYSGWYNSINEAVRELKAEDYGKGDEFTPLVEKSFGYNASEFDYTPENK